MPKAKTNLWIAAVLALVAIVIAIAWVRSHSSAPDLDGEWKSWRSEFRISRGDKGYTIVVNNPDGFLGGVYTGRLRRNVLKVEGPLAPLCSQIVYSSEDDKLEFCGEQFERVGN